MSRSDESLLFAPLPARSPLMRWLKRVVPDPRLGFYTKEARQCFNAFVDSAGNTSGEMCILNIGSKSVTLGPNAINLDVYTYPGVQMIGDGQYLPFKDNSIGSVVITSVLEHVAAPALVVSEIERVLQSDGGVYVEVPFMQPFHPDPEDYYRYSLTGIEELFEHFTIIKKGMCAGPSSGLANVLSQYLAILLSFNNHYLYKIINRLNRFLFTPLTFLDLLLEKNRYSPALASSYFLVGVKHKREH
jgi:SAM-dependent methyltransferase